ncbi:MAG: cation:proton antiporter [Muricoprocola sp.]
MIRYIQLIAGACFLLAGMVILAIQVFGVFRFDYVQNRMHAAAMGDTLGILLSLFGLMILDGFHFTSLKLLLVIVFLWFASPVSSHLIARLASIINRNLDERCEISEEVKEKLREMEED